MTSRGQGPRGGGACECLDPPLQEILDPRLESCSETQFTNIRKFSRILTFTRVLLSQFMTKTSETGA